MRLEPTSRQRLQLLLQRQHIEEEELRLRHFMELEKFRERKLEWSVHCNNEPLIHFISHLVICAFFIFANRNHKR